FQEFKRLFDKYLEQPYLLDGHLEQIVRTLIEPIRSASCPEAVLQKCLIFLQVPTSVRGYKAVVHHLPHEISDIEPVLQLLERVTPIQTACHPTVNMLLLWLSVVAIVPFQLSRLDSGDGFNKSIAERILSIVKVHLSSGGHKTVAPALLAANFITRPDIVDVHLDDFFAWIQEVKQPLFGWLNIMLATLARVFKLANRDVLCKHAKSLLTLLSHKCIKANPNIVVRKLSMKLFQRIGLSYLPANLAPWRHLRRVKQLVDGLNADTSSTEPAFPSMKENTNFEVPPIIEEVVDKLLEGLVDEGLNVRWSAAKGIGRIASRLPKEMASEVVSSIFSQFEAQIENTSWHGGCLALAELGRRGTLLPEHLPQVVDAVVKSLVFDERWGKCAIGSPTRDAACYVTWTLGRSYDPCDIAPFVSSLATTLICVALFDRELNCRRAAAAAFQECVGRLGTFPHGISIISIVSYFSLSRIQTSYLSVSLQVADFPEYTQHLILHLINEKVGHWDRNIRVLCSQALFKLTAKDPHFMIDTCVPKLLAAMSNHDGSVKHGTVLSLAEVVHALSIWAREREKSIEDILGKCLLFLCIWVCVVAFTHKSYAHVTAEIIAISSLFWKSVFMVSSEIASFLFLIESWQSIIEACLRWDDKTLRCQACSSLSVFMEEYYGGDAGACERIVGTYVENLRSPTEGVRSNFAQALGALPSFMHRAYQVPILEGLCLCASSEGYEHVESRKEAVLALSRFYISMGAGGAAGVPDLGHLVAILLKNMEDYSQSPMKGDLGALVRMACMTAFKDVVCYFASVAPEILPETFVAEMMRALAQQCVEPVDNLRVHATKTFLSILHR
ncbi:beta-tubulin cofactor D, putative, partial [Ixodes scapularis]